MTALVTADLHLSSNPRDLYRHEFAAVTLLNLVQKHKPDQLIILGDLTDQKDRHEAALVNDVVNYIKRLAEETRVIVLRGNHDCINPDVPFFGFLRKLSNVEFIIDSKVENIEGLGTCTFLAHTRDYKKSWTRFNFDPYKRDPDCGFIFCHNTFEGADAGHGSPLKGIPTKVLPPDACVISGDVHVPQQLDQITYVGAPYTVTFGDSYKPSVLMIGRTLKNTLQMQLIPVHGIKKLTVDVKDADRLPKLKANPGDLVKVRVHLKAEDYARWPEIQNDVRAWVENSEAQLCQLQPVKTSQQRLGKQLSRHSKSYGELVKAFGTRRSLHSSIIKTGLWLANKIE